MQSPKDFGVPGPSSKMVRPQIIILHFPDKALNRFSHSVANLRTSSSPGLPSDHKCKPLLHSVLALDHMWKEIVALDSHWAAPINFQGLMVLAGRFLPVVFDKKLELWFFTAIKTLKTWCQSCCISRNQDSPVCLRKPKRSTQPWGSPST
jgi:hypothetical protein